MPSWELFERQSSEYRDSVLPPAFTARKKFGFTPENLVAAARKTLGQEARR